MLKKNIAYLLYGVAIILIIIYCIVSLNSNLLISRLERLILLCSSCLFLYFGGLFLTKYKNDNKPMKINLWLFFILYLVLLLTLTLFDQDASRNWHFIFTATREQINNYISNRVNLIPFDTIIKYIKNFNELLDSSILITNVYGNFIACMPLAFFLPMLFKKQNKFQYYLLTIFLIILGIETMQFITLSGSFDIDDFILNLSGALILYSIIRIKSVNNLLHNIFLLTKKNVDKKIIFIVFILGFVGLFCSTLLLKKLASHFYYDYEDHNRIHHSDITFLYNEDCSTNNFFYEDEIYKYYFDCYDEASFYAVVNNEKFKIKDLLDNSEYKFAIDRVLARMKYYNIAYYIEHKYTYYEIEVEINANMYSPPNDYEDEFVKVIAKEKEENMFELNFIPLKAGNTVYDFEILIYDDQGNITETIMKKIDIYIKEDLSVEVEEIS